MSISKDPPNLQQSLCPSADSHLCSQWYSCSSVGRKDRDFNLGRKNKYDKQDIWLLELVYLPAIIEFDCQDMTQASN